MIVALAVLASGRASGANVCDGCNKMQGGLTSTLGPRADMLLRVEALVAGVILLSAWCEHASEDSNTPYAVVITTGAAVALAAAALGGCTSCDDCGSKHFHVLGTRFGVATGPKK